MRFYCLLSILIASANLPCCWGETLATVPVGYAGNAPDQPYPLDPRFPELTGDEVGFGAVDHNYRIGTYEVTNSQYAEFLNAKALSDPTHLYNTEMADSARGGIVRSGTSGNYSYAVKSNMADKPVNYVNWFESVRFVNWISNGQGDGDTESGSYTLLGGGVIPTNGYGVTRNPGAMWVLPTENEWYKAAYYDPRTSAEGGPAGDDHYWLYATQSDDLPTMATADAVGNISNPGPNVVNYGNSANWNEMSGNVTTVGSAGVLSSSFFGTYDQAGNVWEWAEDWYPIYFRLTRQGSFGNGGSDIAASSRAFGDSGLLESSATGFRIAMIPEPATVRLMLLAIVGLVMCQAYECGIYLPAIGTGASESVGPE